MTMNKGPLGMNACRLAAHPDTGGIIVNSTQLRKIHIKTTGPMAPYSAAEPERTERNPTMARAKIPRLHHLFHLSGYRSWRIRRQ